MSGDDINNKINDLINRREYIEALAAIEAEEQSRKGEPTVRLRQLRGISLARLGREDDA